MPMYYVHECMRARIWCITWILSISAYRDVDVQNNFAVSERIAIFKNGNTMR